MKQVTTTQQIENLYSTTAPGPEFYTKEIDAITKFVTDNQEMFYMDYGGAGSEINNLIHGKGKRSYDELQTIIKAYNSKKYTIRTDIFSDIE